MLVTDVCDNSITHTCFHWSLYCSGYREIHQVHGTSGWDRLSDLVRHQHTCKSLDQFHAESIHGLCTAQQALRNFVLCVNEAVSFMADTFYCWGIERALVLSLSRFGVCTCVVQRQCEFLSCSFDVRCGMLPPVALIRVVQDVCVHSISLLVFPGLSVLGARDRVRKTWLNTVATLGITTESTCINTLLCGHSQLHGDVIRKPDHVCCACYT